MRGPLLDITELSEFERAFGRVMAIMRKFQKRLTPRETYVLQIGLRASHIEEAMAHGDFERAEAHLRALVKTIAEMP